MNETTRIGRFILSPICEIDQETKKPLFIRYWVARDSEGREVCEVSHPAPCPAAQLERIIEEHYRERYPREILNGVAQ